MCNCVLDILFLMEMNYFRRILSPPTELSVVVYTEVEHFSGTDSPDAEPQRGVGMGLFERFGVSLESGELSPRK